VQINIDHPGIAVRVEIPREFLSGVVYGENDTHFVQSDIRNDYYYYNLVDEAHHWTYGTPGNITNGHWTYGKFGNPSDGPCYKPDFSFYDPNAPWCLEIWNYLNSENLKQPDYTIYCYTPGSGETYDSAPSCKSISPNYFNENLFPTHILNYTYVIGVDYCEPPNIGKFVFQCFSASPASPKVVLLHGLSSPQMAGLYNFTVSIANRTNILGYPDFVHAWHQTLQVPVSLSDNPASVAGTICDADDPSFKCPTILGKGVVYATNLNTGQMARAYVNPATGQFNLTGLAPGNYNIQGSAGVTDGIAYSLSDTVQVSGIQRGLVESISPLQLHRAPQLCGTIAYYSGSTPLPGGPLSAPIFAPLGLTNLPITIEATDPQGHVFRYQALSGLTSSDPFLILSGENVTYVGSDPYGTEFAGLPSVSSGSYVLTARVWISGYLQAYSVTFTVSSMPGSITPVPCVSPDQGNPIVMNAGGLIAGTIHFSNLQVDETPLDGTHADFPTLTHTIFGGNLIVEASDHTGVLRGVTVMAWNPSWETLKTIPFYVFGFSEYYNRTCSASWDSKDYGLPSDSGYSLTVLMRGYEQNVTTPSSISVAQGGVSTVDVRMLRGGAIQVTVGSYDNRPGTLAIQAEQPWRFFNYSIPIRARVYFYDPIGATVGFVEKRLANYEIGVSDYSLTVIFTGQNYTLREILFYGLLPTHITNENYTIKAYTLGYIQPRVSSIQDGLCGLGFSFIPLFIANEVDVVVPIFSNPNLLGSIPEHSHSLVLVYDTTFGSVLSGALTDNITAGRQTLDFPCFGFGAALYNGAFNGQGHFFYVDSGGARHFDYGLGANIQVGTTYTSQLPEFGFDTHFMQISASPTVTFSDLYLEQGTFITAVQMASIIQGTSSAVQGYISGISSPPFVIPLTWVSVQASNSSIYRYTSTVDGMYDGVEALFLPAGTYSITFSVSFYYSQTVNSFPVGWSGVYSLLPPLGYLCPIAGSQFCSPPSTSQSPTNTSTGSSESQSAMIPAVSTRREDYLRLEPFGSLLNGV
jgi:hypothetical protein